MKNASVFFFNLYLSRKFRLTYNISWMWLKNSAGEKCYTQITQLSIAQPRQKATQLLNQ